MNEIIKSFLPAIATALGGPLAGVAVNFLASKLGVDSTNEAVTNALTGMSAEQLIKIKQLDLDFQKHMADNGIALQLAQIEVNKEEAKSESLFVSGWRPGAGWVGVVSLAYVGLVEPVICWIARVGFAYKGDFPEVDSTITLQILMGLLGLGAARTYEKVKGTK